MNGRVSHLGSASSPRPVGRLLYVSYAFPPVGGAGVQRTVKFTKYLPDHGWLPTVLTVANPSVPVVDADHDRDLRPTTTVVRAKTWEPGYGAKRVLIDPGRRGRAVRAWARRGVSRLLVPDAQVLWNPMAYRAAVRSLRERPHAAILATGPPFSSFLLGRRLKRRFGLPLVLDFRDEWTLSRRYLENLQGGGPSARREQRMMNRVLADADAVIATTEASAEELRRGCRDAGGSAIVTHIYNGFDPDDFDFDDLPAVASERSDAVNNGAERPLELVYTGTLWNLTDVTPLVRGVETLHQRRPDLAANLKLVFIGRRTPAQEQVLTRLAATSVTLQRVGYLPHRECLRRAAAADALCLLLADRPGAERVVPGKLFEYLALGRPVLAIVPAGETRRLLEARSAIGVYHPRDSDGIARWLQSALDGAGLDARTSGAADVIASGRVGAPAEPSLADFSRAALTARLAALLNRIAACEPRGCR